ncbi:hypothetical protein ZIOFF_007473 [Zingiber officinale]|uniref:Uncharacterized protein n=1 Tax=Zingiber officinale TaxID=94328 RepID=A0A8J5HQU4_ZINOF|nr:hypothetical protein ZIOFF_007473 [Zingiber officinale]
MCCGSKRFAKELTSASPFSDLHHAIQSAHGIWFNKVTPLNLFFYLFLFFNVSFLFFLPTSPPFFFHNSIFIFAFVFFNPNLLFLPRCCFGVPVETSLRFFRRPLLLVAAADSLKISGRHGRVGEVIHEASGRLALLPRVGVSAIREIAEARILDSEVRPEKYEGKGAIAVEFINPAFCSKVGPDEDPEITGAWNCWLVLLFMKDKLPSIGMAVLGLLFCPASVREADVLSKKSFLAVEFAWTDAFSPGAAGLLELIVDVMSAHVELQILVALEALAAHCANVPTGGQRILRPQRHHLFTRICLRRLLLTALFVASLLTTLFASSLLTTLFTAFFAASLLTALFAASLLTTLFAASFLAALFIASTFGLATSSSRPLLSAIFVASFSPAPPPRHLDFHPSSLPPH